MDDVTKDKNGGKDGMLVWCKEFQRKNYVLEANIREVIYTTYEK